MSESVLDRVAQRAIRVAIYDALVQTRGNLTKTAAFLRVPLRTLRRHIERLRLKKVVVKVKARAATTRRKQFKAKTQREKLLADVTREGMPRWLGKKPPTSKKLVEMRRRARERREKEKQTILSWRDRLPSHPDR